MTTRLALSRFNALTPRSRKRSEFNSLADELTYSLPHVGPLLHSLFFLLSSLKVARLPALITLH
jgi:hypothetical protein